LQLSIKHKANDEENGVNIDKKVLERISGKMKLEAIIID